MQKHQLLPKLAPQTLLRSKLKLGKLDLTRFPKLQGFLVRLKNQIKKPRSLRDLGFGNAWYQRLENSLRKLLPANFRFNYKQLKRSLHSFGSHWAMVILALSVIVSGVTPKSLAHSSNSNHFKTVAQLASADYFNEDVIYDEVIVTVGEDSDYIFKTGATETVISRNNRTSTLIYDVKAGESLASVARDFGISADTLKYANNLPGTSLSSGQKLKIPAVDGIFITIQKNDTLSGIANKYKVQLSEIRKYNDLPESEPIFAGQEILVPGVVVAKPQPVTRPGGTTRAPTGTGVKFIPGGEGKFIWPLASATHFISQGYKNYHRALDLNRLNGYEIYASAAGTVSLYSSRYGYGNQIDINHGGGFVTRYGHLSEFRVKNGESVKQGQLIGIMGSTGRSTGPHLHFEIRVNDVPQNPLNYLPR